MADGRLLFDTKLDDSGVKKGLADIGGLAKNSMKVVSGAFVAGAAAIAGLGAVSVKIGMEFEAQMSRVQAISGATGEELKSLNDLALQLGADTAFSAKEAADGMENLASAGFSVNEITKAMPGLLDLAAVSGGDVAAASETAASAIRAFGLEAEDAGHVANVFAKAAADTNAEVADMGEAMKYVAPVAQAMGQSLEETAAAIGIMSDSGIKGSQAGTALRGALSRLAKPSEVMATKMDELGLSFYDAQGNMLPLNGIIQTLKDKTEGLTQEQKNNALVTLFGQESLSGMLALVDAGPDKLNALTESLKDSDGAAQEMASTMLNNTKGAIEEMMGSAETLGITIYQSTSGPLKAMAETATGYLNQLTKAFTDSNTGAAGFGEAVGLILSDIALKFAESAPQMITAAGQIMESFFNGIKSSNFGEAGAAVVTGLIQTFLQFAGEFLSIGVSIVTSIITGIAQNSEGLLQVGLTAINQIVTSITQNLPILLTSGIQILTTILQGLTDSIPLMLPSIVQMITQIGTILTENLPLLLTAGMALLTAIATGITQAIPELIPTVLSMITTFVDFIIENLPAIVSLGLDMIMALAQGLIDNLPWFIATLPRLINEFTSELFKQLPKILKLGLDIIVALGKGLIENIPLLIANIPAIILAIINAFTLSKFLALGKTLITNIGSGISSMVSNLGTTASNIATNAINAIKGIFNGGISVGTTLITNIKNGVLSFGTSLQIAATSIANGALTAIKGAFSGAASIGSDLIRGIWNGISGMTSWIINLIGGFATSVVSAIKNFFGIESPSKVMSKEVGKWLPPGIAVGFDKSMPQLNKDIDKQMAGLTRRMETEVEARAKLTGSKLSANSNVYLPNPYDRKSTRDGSTAMVMGDINVVSELDGRAVGYGTSRFSSEEMSLDDKRRQY